MQCLQDPTDFQPPQLNTNWGGGAAIGNLDLDTGTPRFELAIGFPGFDTFEFPDQGAVIVTDVSGSYSGCQDYQTGIQTLIKFEPTCPGDDFTNWRLGESIAMGDLNGDGFIDIAIGAPKAPVDGLGSAGRVLVVFGSQPSIPGTPAFQGGRLRLKRPLGAQAGALFGFSLAIGDFDGDGNLCKEQMIGAPKANLDGMTTEAGEVWIVNLCENPQSCPGVSDPVDPSGLCTGCIPHTFTRLLSPQPKQDEQFGSALAAFDLDDQRGADPRPCVELVIGIPGGVDQGIAPGEVLVYPGCDPGLTWLRDPTPEDLGRFGESVAAGYARQDFVVGPFSQVGQTDPPPSPLPPNETSMIVVGTPFATDGMQAYGEAHVFFLGTSGWVPTTVVSPLYGQPRGQDGEFGDAVAAGDLNFDVMDDVLFGAPGESIPCGPDRVTGRTYFLLSNFLQPLQSQMQELAHVCNLCLQPSGDTPGFGSILAAVIDQDSDVRDMQGMAGTVEPAKESITGEPRSNAHLCTGSNGVDSGRAVVQQDYN